MMDRVHQRSIIPLIAAVSICLHGDAGSVVPSFWNVRTQAAFSSGELNNITVDSRGVVSLSPTFELIGETGELYIWSLARNAAGDVFAGTGSEGKIFKLDKGSGELSLWCDLPDPDVLSLVSGEKGELYAGTSGSGLIYRIDSTGTPSTFYETGARYVWTLVRDAEGTIYAGTGDAGHVYKIDANGEGRQFFDSPETHIMSLIPGKPGTLYAGGEGQGIVYELSLENARGFVLHEVKEREVSSLALAADGTLYVGATSGTKPGPESGQPVEPPRTPSRSGDEAPSDNAIGGASVISEIPAANGPLPQISITQGPGGRPRTHGGGTGGSTLYAIAPDGVVSEIWRSPDATLHSLAVVDDDVLIGTGNKGHVYRVVEGEETWSILVQSSSSQVTAIMTGSETVVVGSANAGDLQTLGTGHAASGTIESAAHDATTWSKWGRLTWDGTQPKGTGVTLSTRGGNTSSPDSSWSEWAQVKDESITSPNSRFMQWRAELESSRRDRSPTLRSVSASYQQRNLKPEVASVFVVPGSGNSAPKGSPGAGGRPSSNKRGGSKAARLPSPQQPVKGKWTIRWQAHDANGDELRHALFFREFGADDRQWKQLEADLEATSYPLDSSALPDGLYVIKAVSTDEPDNPAASALAGERVSDPFPVDNTNPQFVNLEAVRIDGSVRVSGAAEDGTGPLWKGFYALNGGEWKPFFPTDEIFDSKQESFSFLADLPDGSEHTLVVRVRDLAGNVGVRQIEID